MLLTPPEEAEEVVKAEEFTETEEAVAPVTPLWTQVHPSRPVAPVGLVPHSLGDKWHCHCHYSHYSHRRAFL